MWPRQHAKALYEGYLGCGRHRMTGLSVCSWKKMLQNSSVGRKLAPHRTFLQVKKETTKKKQTKCHLFQWNVLYLGLQKLCLKASSLPCIKIVLENIKDPRVIIYWAIHCIHLLFSF